MTILIDAINQCRETRKSQDYDDHSIIRSDTGRQVPAAGKSMVITGCASILIQHRSRRAKRTEFIDTMKQRYRDRERDRTVKEERRGGTRGSLAMYFRWNPLAVVTEGHFDTTDNPDSEMHSGRSFA